MWHHQNSVQTVQHPLDSIVNDQNRESVIGMSLKRPEPMTTIKMGNNTQAVDDDEEIKAIRKVNIISAVSGIGFLLIMLLLVMRGYMKLTGPYQPMYLQQFSAKLEFTIRYQALGVLTIAISIIIVMVRRAMTPAVDPTGNYESLVSNHKNVLQNTLEQFTMSSFIQMVMACNLEPQYIMAYVPYMAITFFIGRIAYIIGYPKYRGFGFAVSFIPTLIATLFNAYAAFRFLFS